LYGRISYDPPFFAGGSPQVRSLSLKVMGENLFLIEFEHSWDKSRVPEARPWVFEGNLFSVSDYDGCTPPTQICFDTVAFLVRMYRLPMDCMGMEVRELLGSTVGVADEVDMDEEGVEWGEYLRVRIQINLYKPLVRGRILTLSDRSF
jgi:hypothetical protein